jgi:hypothetical protein
MFMSFLRAAALFLLAALCSFGQLNRGTITGTLTDSSGAVIPSVQVQIRNTSTNVRTEATSTGDGQYTVPGLPPGQYEITFQTDSFKKLVRSGIELGATQVLRVDGRLEVGAVSDSVEVTAAAARIETDSAEVATSLGGKEMRDLPINISETASGVRTPEAFVYKLVPGVTGDPYIPYVNGSQGQTRETLLDGASTTAGTPGAFSEAAISPEAIQEIKIETSGLGAQFGRTQGGVFNFVMKSGTNDLHGSGFIGVRREWMNANSFTNNFYGLPRARDRKLNYAGSFGGPVVLPKLYNGKDRTFFYTTYERFKQRMSGISAPNRTAPLPEFYNGDFSRLLGAATGSTDALGNPVLRGAIYDPASFRQLAGGRWAGDMFTGNKIPVSRFSQVANNINSLARGGYSATVRDASGQFPLVNNAVGAFDAFPTFDQYAYTLKADHAINGRNKLTGSLSYVARPRQGFGSTTSLYDAAGGDPGGPLSSAQLQRVRYYFGRIAWDWTVTPRIVQNLSVNYNRMINPINNLNIDTDGAAKFGIKNLSTKGYPQINWGSGPFVTLGSIGTTMEYFQATMGYGLADTWSFSSGRHFLKWGVDVRANPAASRNGNGGAFNFAARSTAIPNEAFSGTQTGYSFASYLLGIVDNATLSAPVTIGSRRHYTALFLNDDFRVNNRLTLNIGLRWDYQPPYTEQYNRMAAWTPDKKDPISGLPGAYVFAGDCSACMGRNYFGTKDYKGLFPRLGFAYQPFTHWTIRGAYGILVQADVGSLPTSAFAWQGAYNLAADPIYPWNGSFKWDAGFPTDRYIAPTYDVSRGNTIAPNMVDPRYGTNPYIQDWNLNIQRQLPGRIVLDVGYVGNKGTRLPLSALSRINQLPASVLTQYGSKLSNPVTNAAQAAANGIAYPYPGFSGTVASALRQYPQVQGNSTISAAGAPLGFSTYNSLQVAVNKSVSKGFSFYGNYVWSRAIGNTNSSMVDYYNARLEKSAVSWDIPHVVKAYVNYELPFGKGMALLNHAPALVNTLVNGWAVSCIMNYRSGQPLGFSGASSPYSSWNGGQRPNVAAGDLKASTFDYSNFDYAHPNSIANTYVNKALVSDPAAFTLGNSAPRYTQLLGQGFANEDIGIFKNNRIRENYRVQLRIEMLNAFNRHILGTPNLTVTSPQFGQITTVSGFRTIQATARFDF